MQDMRTGNVVSLDQQEAVARTLKKQGHFKKRIAELMVDKQFRHSVNRAAGELAGIPAHHQGPVFDLDEVLEIKGSRFRVRGFEGGLLHLEGLPKA